MHTLSLRETDTLARLAKRSEKAWAENELQMEEVGSGKSHDVKLQAF